MISSRFDDFENETKERRFGYQKITFWNKFFKPKSKSYYDEVKCVYHISDVFAYLESILKSIRSEKSLKNVLDILSTKDIEFGDSFFMLVARWSCQEGGRLSNDCANILFRLSKIFLFTPGMYNTDMALQFFSMLNIKNKNDESLCTILAKNYAVNNNNQKIIQEFCSALIGALFYSGANCDDRVDDINGFDVEGLLMEKDRAGYSLFDLKDRPDIKESIDTLIERCEISKRRNEKYSSTYSCRKIK